METGKEKIDRICALLKEETIKPAQEQVKELLDNARNKAEKIISDANSQKQALLKQAEVEIEKKKKIFDTSLDLGAKNTLETLRQTIEKNLFSEKLQELVAEKSSDETVISDFLSVVTEAIKKEGLESDLQAQVAKNVSKENIIKLLAGKVGEQLDKEKIIEGNFAGGAKLSLVDKQMTIDLSDRALKDLLAEFLQKDFRQILFNV
jgi:V/A-type H+-transporting ATPase subunit E